MHPYVADGPFVFLQGLLVAHLCYRDERFRISVAPEVKGGL